MDDRTAYVDAGPAENDLSGTLVDNKYQVVRALGRGSAGTVYLCWHIALDKQIALKVLHPQLTGNPGMVARFQREAQAAARLEHPNSIRVLDFGQDPANGLLYLAMEYVEAPDLGHVLTHEWPVSDRRIVGIMSQVLSALSAAHALGIVHRDLKPENILVRAVDSHPEHDDYDEYAEHRENQHEDRVQVCDFGIAQLSPIRLTGSPTASSARLERVTGHGMVVGTPSYMSPEQARAEAQDARSDIYSAGVVLFQLLTRTLPFMADTPLSVAVMHCTMPPPPPSGYGPVNSALEAACLKALSKTPEARFQSAREMHAALEAALSRQAVSGALARRISSLPAAPMAAHGRNTRNQPAHVRHPSLAPAERVVPIDTVPKHHWAPLVVAGLVLTIVAVGWLPRFLADDVNDAVQLERASRPQPSAAEAKAAIDPATPAHAEPAARPSAAPPTLPAPRVAASAAPQAPPHASAVEPALDTAIAMASSGRHTTHHHAHDDAERSRPSSATSATLQEAYGTEGPVPDRTALVSAAVGEIAERLILNPLGPTADLPSAPASAAPTAPTRQPENTAPASAPASVAAAPVAEPAPAVGALPTASPATSAALPTEPPPATSAALPTEPPPTTSAALPTEPPPAINAGLPTAPPPAADVAKPIAPKAAVIRDPTRARVAIGDPFTRAAVSKVSIINAVNESAVTGCYQKALRNGEGPTHPLSARLDFSTNMGGRIVFASVHGSELPKVLRDCIEHVTRQGRVREADTGEAQASVTLNFDPR